MTFNQWLVVGLEIGLFILGVSGAVMSGNPVAFFLAGAGMMIVAAAYGSFSQY
jgi:uncharacterized membrane protein